MLFPREVLEQKISEYCDFALDAYNKKIGAEYELKDYLLTSFSAWLTRDDPEYTPGLPRDAD